MVNMILTCAMSIDQLPTLREALTQASQSRAPFQIVTAFCAENSSPSDKQVTAIEGALTDSFQQYEVHILRDPHSTEVTDAGQHLRSQPEEGVARRAFVAVQSTHFLGNLQSRTMLELLKSQLVEETPQDTQILYVEVLPYSDQRMRRSRHPVFASGCERVSGLPVGPSVQPIVCRI